MTEFQAKSICILGRQPELGLAELESLYGAENVRPLNAAAVLSIETQDIDFKRLGGSIKIARILTRLPNTSWNDLTGYLIEKIPEHMRYQPAGKFTLGLSVYDLPVSLDGQNKSLMAIKRAIRATGKSARIVPNKTPALNSAQVLHNKLTTRGAWELLLVRDGKQTILAQTIFVQDIDAYAARDQARPARDARVGMLPPKLAQIMINLTNPPALGTLLDPFCGTGVVLQEALLMELDAYGTDIDPRMVKYTKENLDWLFEKNDASKGGKLSMQFNVQAGDATNTKWPHKIDVVASEVYLGRPLVKLPPSEELYKIAGDVNTIFKKFLANLSSQVKPGTRICLAVPAWRTKNGFVSLPALENLSDLGYNQLDFKHVKRSGLIYFRENQIVARQLVVLEKK